MPNFSGTGPSEAAGDFSRWRELISANYYLLDCRRLAPDQAFQASLFSANLGEARVHRIHSSATVYSRGSDQARKVPSDEFHFFMLLNGRANLSQLGRDAMLQSGDLCLYDGGLAFNLECPEEYEALVYSVPRKLLSARFGGAEQLACRVMPGNSRIVTLARGVIGEAALPGADFSDATSARLGTTLTDILSVALEAELVAALQHDSRHDMLLARAKQFMLDRLSDSELDTDTIASNLNIGPRTLQRMFAAEGTTAMRWLWQQRLNASRRALAQGEVKQVSEAAINFGFSNFSHFSRAFKAAFGVSPHKVPEGS